MMKLCFNPLFLLGLGIRVVLMVFFIPASVFDWYVPFLQISVSSFTIDPWSVWIDHGGSPAAFPYGYAMWLAFVPATLAASLFDLPIKFAYEVSLLGTDFFLLLTLHRLLPSRHRLLLAAYWLSPIVILATYAFGFNDLIPAAFLMFAVLCLKRIRLQLAGVLCALAVSAKLSMVIALPLFIIYLYNNKSLREHMSKFLVGFVVSGFVLGMPFVFSKAGLSMLVGNPEMEKIYSLAFYLNRNFSVYVVPLIYLILLYSAWRIRRMNFDLFQVITGITLLLIVLLTPASPGWYVWSLPFLVLYQAMSGRIAMALISVLSLSYAASILLVTPLLLVNGHNFELGPMLHIYGEAGGHVVSLLHTAMVAIGCILAIRMWRESVTRSEFFRLSRTPFVIGIAGDSGAGKDTFSDSLAELFGNHSVAKLSGDDYHLWDRQKPMWQVMTHLNPAANNLEGFTNDLVALSDGKCLYSRHYDHQTGKMSKPSRLPSNDFIIASGLHALYLPILRDFYNLKVYLDIDEGLRRHFKIKRDVEQRGYSLERVLSSFTKREPDSERFIRPQSAYADLTLALQPIHPGILVSSDNRQPIRLKLLVKTRHSFNELSLHRVLVGVCGLHVDMVVSSDGTEVQMTIEGDTSSSDIAMAAKILCPRIFEFLDIDPKWKDGILGLMQLVTISHISQAMTKRVTL